MDQLERYLDEVCRGIGGPLELREHVRQELREHLLDAVAQHEAAGMSKESALAKAIAEFGQPDEVRSELEATHGKRMTWIIDKAMQWKEKTMKAKWLWMTWAHAAVILLGVFSALAITFQVVFLVPKFQKIMYDGIIDSEGIEEIGAGWIVRFISEVSYLAGHYTLFFLLALAVAWGLFEWRVKSEHKSYMRLSALGTLSAALTVVAVFLAGFMIIAFQLGVPAVGRMARPWAVEQVAGVDSALNAMDVALAKKNWDDLGAQSAEIRERLDRLSARISASALVRPGEPPTINELQASVKEAREKLSGLDEAVRAKDAVRVGAEMARFRNAFDPVHAAAKRGIK